LVSLDHGVGKTPVLCPNQDVLRNFFPLQCQTS
jgi:hypothetical protein